MEQICNLCFLGEVLWLSKIHSTLLLSSLVSVHLAHRITNAYQMLSWNSERTSSRKALHKGEDLPVLCPSAADLSLQECGVENKWFSFCMLFSQGSHVGILWSFHSFLETTCQITPIRILLGINDKLTTRVLSWVPASLPLVLSPIHGPKSAPWLSRPSVCPARPHPFGSVFGSLLCHHYWWP